MYSIKTIINKSLLVVILTAMMASCKKMSLQKDYDRTPHTVDPHVYKTAWEYLKQRALGNTSNDSVWKRMYEAILYAEIDSQEYIKTGRTYIFLNNDAITRTNSNASDVGFFDAYRINGVVGKKITDYPKDFVKNYL